MIPKPILMIFGMVKSTNYAIDGHENMRFEFLRIEYKIGTKNMIPQKMEV